MRTLAAAVTLVFALAAPAVAGDLELQTGTKVEFVARDDAAKLLATRDAFVAALSPFDRAARLKTDKETSEKAFLDFVAAQALDWSDDERTIVTKLVTDLAPRLEPLKLALPSVVRLVRTTGKEEGGAAYCRNGAIVLPSGMLLPKRQRELAAVLPHEIFHIYTSQNPKLRPALYAVVGFGPCESVAFPESLATRKITNPDAPGMDFIIHVRDGGVDGAKVAAIPILFSRTETYDTKAGGELFKYLQFRLLVLEADGTRWKVALDTENKPRLLERLGDA